MIALDSPRWSELEHAYGAADNIPALLQQLETYPSNEGNNEPWFSLWSSLYHQGDIYPASFAAVPHVIDILEADPMHADFSFFQLPACIEIARAKDDFPIPPDLKEPYFEALRRILELVAASAKREWDSNLICCILSALAASKGFPSIAEASLELDPDTAVEFLEWFENR
jgi:hypothetical protein